MEKTSVSGLRKRKKETIQVKTPSKELEQLNIFLGTWKIDGQNHEAAPVLPNAKIEGEEIYMWHPGNFFLNNKWNRQFGEQQHIGLGMIGYNELLQHFSVTNFDNMGYERIYIMTPEHKSWKLRGEKERATIEFSNDGQSFKQKWELQDENLHWKPLCTVNGSRVKSEQN